MKIICKKNHWRVKDGQLILDTPTGDALAKQVITTLEAQIRLDIYEKICAMPLTTNRKQLIKLGLDNVALMVQDACAQIALGEK
jgi:hypothetical protein